jgi:hypothetical protein
MMFLITLYLESSTKALSHQKIHHAPAELATRHGAPGR